MRKKYLILIVKPFYLSGICQVDKTKRIKADTWNTVKAINPHQALTGNINNF